MSLTEKDRLIMTKEEKQYLEKMKEMSRLRELARQLG